MTQAHENSLPPSISVAQSQKISPVSFGCPEIILTRQLNAVLQSNPLICESILTRYAKQRLVLIDSMSRFFIYIIIIKIIRIDECTVFSYFFFFFFLYNFGLFLAMTVVWLSGQSTIGRITIKCCTFMFPRGWILLTLLMPCLFVATMRLAFMVVS